MLFNSYNFIFLFLPISCIYYYFFFQKNLNKYNLIFLIIISLLFYSFWNKIYIFLLIGSILINFIFAKTILFCDQKKYLKLKKIIFIISIISNVLLLSYFKYFNFFVENVNSIFETSFTFKNIILPLAISFFTIQQINFLIEIYFNKNKNFTLINYFLFVSFFPQLIAGPIVTYSNLIPQFNRNKFIKIYENVLIGLIIFVIGLFKKVVLADSIGVYADKLFEISDLSKNINSVDTLVGSIAFTFQIYFDFSGYSDMAIGLARMFGIILPINFLSPYKSKNIITYWKAWHITFTSFITSKIYAPINLYVSKKILLFSKKNYWLNIFGIFIPMIFAFLISGFWHGASWNFVIWGLAHGVLLVINHNLVLFSKNNQYFPRYKFLIFLNFLYDNYFKVLVTFFLVNLVNILFRSKDLEQSLFFYKSLFNLNFINNIYTNYYLILIFIFLMFLFVWVLPNTDDLIKIIKRNFDKKVYGYISYKLLYMIVFVIIFFMTILFMKSSPEFIYFQF